jgi:hypothetical protein
VNARRLAPIALLLVLVAGALVWLLRGPSAPSSAPEPAGHDAGAPAPADAGLRPAVVPSTVTLRKLEGTVEIQRGGAGPWQKASSGDALSANDAIRTAAGASVELVAGEHVVRLVPGTDVTVQELTANLSGFLLGRGLIGAEATSAPGTTPRALEIRAKDTDAAVRATDGRFRMSSNGEGTVAVGVEEGEVNVSGAGSSVVLKKGERTLVRPNQAPAAPQPFATDLLVDVAWPKERSTNRRVITVTGRTDAGALLFALGRPITVAEDGSFRARLKLKEGKNRIRVEGWDVSGNEVDKSELVVVNTKGADSRFDTKDLWGK